MAATLRYRFDLAADLPDSLFAVDAARAPERPRAHLRGRPRAGREGRAAA